MNLFQITQSYIRKRLLNTLLNILLLAIGIATIVILLLFNQQLQANLHKNATGIDLVVGAKGSPLQLILSSIYHVDVPTGNIPLKDAKILLKRREVKKAIPLALGDSYRGYRIVGTDSTYPEHYQMELTEGRLWNTPFEVTVGAQVASQQDLKIGDNIISSHGLSSGAEHEEQPMTVVGIFKNSGTTLDRLVLTSVETVWHVHEEHHNEEEHDEHHEATNGDEHHQNEESEEREITAYLIQYSSPIAVVSFPRFINEQTNMQAASPPFETVRLLSLLGVGLDAIRSFAFILVAAAVLSIFVALYNALKAREYDLAIMRTLGASKQKLFWQVILESSILTFAGALLGFILGHTGTYILGVFFRGARQMNLTGWVWTGKEIWLIVFLVGLGVLSGIIPAYQAYKTDIVKTLSKK